MGLTAHQGIALANHCRLAGECANPIFHYLSGPCSIVLTVNSGYE